jgi:hypothetical protein
MRRSYGRRSSKVLCPIVAMGIAAFVLVSVQLVPSSAAQFPGVKGEASIGPLSNMSSESSRVTGCANTSQRMPMLNPWNSSSSSFIVGGIAQATDCSTTQVSSSEWNARLVIVVPVVFKSGGDHQIVVTWKIAYASTRNDSGFPSCVMNYSVASSECFTASDTGLIGSATLLDENNSNFLSGTPHFSITFNESMRSFSGNSCSRGTCVHRGGNYSNLRHFFSYGVRRLNLTINASGAAKVDSKDTYEIKLILDAFADAKILVKNARMGLVRPVSSWWDMTTSNPRWGGAHLQSISIS